MSLYKTKFNPFTKKRQWVPSDTIITFKDAIDTSANLPMVGNNVNDARITSDTGNLWVWDGTSWIDQGDIIDLEWSAINGKPASTPLQIDETVARYEYATVTVGTTGADYDNFDDAIDYLRTLNGGRIIVLTDMVINCASDKDVSHIEFIGATGQFFIELTPGILTGKWHGSMVKFDSFQFNWMGASTHFLETRNDRDEISFRNCMIMGILPGKEIIDAMSKQVNIFLQWSGAITLVKNSEGVVVHGIYNTLCQNNSNLNFWVYDSSSRLIGTSTHTQVLDWNSLDNNKSSVSGASTKDALETLDSEKTTLSDVKADTDVADAISKKHTQNTDEYLTTEITNTIYVDGNRTDSYIEDGSFTKPFKSIQVAIDSVTGATWNNIFNINIAPGEYTEQIIMKSFVHLTTEILDSVTIKSSVGDVITCSAYANIQNLAINYIGSDSSKVGLRINNGGVLVAREVSIYGTYTGVVLEPGAIALFYGGGTLTGTADSFIVKNGAFCWLNNITLSGWGAPYYDLTIESGGIVETMVLQLYNERLNNLGTLTLISPSSRIKNDSSVVGTSVKDALNTLNTDSHVQNTDTILDNGGSNQIGADEIIKQLANSAYIAILRAKDNVVSVFGILNGIVDGYADESGIDTVNSVNQYYNVADYYTNNPGTYGSDITTSAQAISSSDLGGYPKDNAFDNNSSTLWACNDYYLSGIAENAYIGQDFGTNQSIRRFTIRQDSPGNRVSEVYLEYSDNGTDWTTLQIITGIPDISGVQTYDTNNGGTHRYWRLRVKTMHQPASTSWNVHEIEMMVGSGASSMTLLSKDFVLSETPTEYRMFTVNEEVSSLILNTDLNLFVSRDGGTSWTQATLLDLGEYETNKHIYFAKTDVSSQPSGSTMKYKITTLNGIEIKVNGVYQYSI